MSVVQRLDALYAELPDVPCTGQCHTSCSYIGMSEAEHRRIERDTGYVIEMHQSPCPALDFAGRCSIYSLRPVICRIYGSHERLRCPYGCKPERWLTDSEVTDLFRRVEAIAGAHNAEEAALVASVLRSLDPTLGEPK
jgi:Fe-S-cluster containining protein